MIEIPNFAPSTVVRGNDHGPNILLHLLVFGLIFDDFAAFFAGFGVF